MPYTAILTLAGPPESPYSQSKPVPPEAHPKKKKGETDDEADIRIMHHRAHVNAAGNVIIPGEQISGTIQQAAKRFPATMKGMKTYTTYFHSGILVDMDMEILDANGKPIPLRNKDGSFNVEFKAEFVDAQGARGGGKVWRRYPIIRGGWTGTIPVLVLDDTIPKKVFKETVEMAGRFQGLGRFRPANRGRYGRFTVVDCVFEDAEQTTPTPVKEAA